MVKINFLHFSPDLSNFLQFKPILSAGEDFLNIIRRICQPCVRASEYDWIYGLEPENMVLEVRARGYDRSYGWEPEDMVTLVILVSPQSQLDLDINLPCIWLAV